MLASWVMFGVLGNEIRSADEILPVGQDEIPAVGGGEIRPLVGLVISRRKAKFSLRSRNSLHRRWKFSRRRRNSLSPVQGLISQPLPRAAELRRSEISRRKAKFSLRSRNSLHRRWKFSRRRRNSLSPVQGLICSPLPHAAELRANYLYFRRK